MKTLRQIETVLFLCALICPTLCWLEFGGSDENLEKRELAELPAFDLSDPTAFVGGLDAWYTDHLPFKNAATRLQSSLDYHLFHTSSTNNVLVGSDGWLFYSTPADGNPMADYKGTSSYNEDDLQHYGDLIEQAQRNLSSQDIELYVLFAPNKELAYSRYMPQEVARVSDRAKASQLVDYLQGRGFTFCTYLDQLIDAAEHDDALYYRLDTHWNLRGAYLAYEEFCKMANARPVPASLKKVPHTGGDLASLLNLPLDEPAYYENEIIGYEEDPSLEDGEVKMYHSTRQDADPRTIMILSDSFRYNFEGFAAAGFARTASMPRHTCTMGLMESFPFKPDVILLLAPERYVSKPREVIGRLGEARFE